MRTTRKFQAGLLALLVLAACAEQKEGERCDRSNADLDCEEGLRCLAIPGQEGAICCPTNRPPTDDLCRTANIGGGGSSGSGGSSSGGVNSGGTNSGGSESGGTGGTTTDAAPGLPPDAGIDGAPQSG
jgi:uncharacterized membrane protein YgcG